MVGMVDPTPGEPDPTTMTSDEADDGGGTTDADR
jgi:hypothetical protein